MTHGLVLLVCFVAISLMGAALFIFLSRRSGNEKYREAVCLETRGDFKSACYSYAVAILNGTAKSRECRKRIKALWQQYGPFDYQDVAKQLEAEGDTPEGCGAAGHAATLSIIKEVAARA